QDRRQRLLPVFVDGSLQSEGRQLGFEPNKCGSHCPGLEVHLAHLRRRDRLTRDAAAALPIDVDGLDGLEGHMYGAIDGRAGFLQDPGDAEGLVIVLHERDRAETVRHDNGIIHLVAEGRSHLSADDGVEKISEWTAGAEAQALRLSILVMLEVIW